MPRILSRTPLSALLLSCTACFSHLAIAQSAWTSTIAASSEVAPFVRMVALDAQRVLVQDFGGLTLVLNQQMQNEGVGQLGTLGFAAPVRTADGGLLKIVYEREDEERGLLAGCEVQRFDPQLKLRWQQKLQQRSNNNTGDCLGVTVDGAGGVWAADGNLYRLSFSDGVQRVDASQTAVEIDTVGAIAADPAASGGVFAKVIFAEQDRHGAVRLNADGSVDWRWIETLPNHGYSSIHRSSKGDVVLLGSGSDESGLFGARVVVLDSRGELRWRFNAVPNSQSRIVVGHDGRVLIHTRQVGLAAPPELFALDAAGNELWRQNRTVPPGANLQDVTLQLDPNGGLLVVEQFLGPEGTFSQQYERLDASGAMLWRKSPSENLANPILRADGSVVALQFERGVLQRFAPADGSSSEFPLAAASFAQTLPRIVQMDASGRLAVSTFDQTGHSLTVLAADGQQKWRSTTSSDAISGVSLAQAERVCTMRTGQAGAHFECRRDSDGALLWERAVPLDSAGADLVAYAGLSDGRQSAVLELRSGFGTTGRTKNSGASNRPAALVDRPHLLRVDSQGALQLQRALAPTLDWAYFSADGELLWGTQSTVQRLDREGQLRFDASLTGLGLSASGAIQQGRPLGSGESLLIARPGSDQTTALELLLLDSNGVVRWRQPLPESLDSTRFRVIEQGGDLLLTNIAASGVEGPAQSGLVRVRRLDGALLWQVRAPYRRDFCCDREWVLDASGQRVAFGSPLRDSYELQSYATDDGRLLGQRTLAFAPDSGGLGARLNAAGQLRVISLVEPPDAGWRVRVDAVDDAFAVPTNSSVDRVARSGAWYDASSAGQGWLIDIIPASRTLYAAWFTFERGDGAPLSTPARLRWYSLQGSYTEGAQSVSLDILENRDGVFAAAPATSARKVGSAVLRFDGCASGVLDYQFDQEENGARSDRVPLRALAIRDPACPQAASEVQANGYSSASSGAWFDPATGGQGLVGVVQPPSAGRSGLLFAGWFHYDPAGAADDPRAQAWLTLQGTLDGAVAGTTEVGIFRTLGGRLGGPSTANTNRIGTATVQFQGCDRMRLSYSFDDAQTSAPYAGISGTQQLQKIGGCSRP